ncbi:MAG: hypothetical protein OSJ58_21190, partial [Dysosmobacter sp.]|nr:hypothetical protein [Dysosmobacter sp.]
AEIDAQANIIPIDTTPTALPPTAAQALGAPPQPATIPQTNPGTGEIVEPTRQPTAQAATVEEPGF